MRISLEQALNILMDHVTHGKTERKPLEDCLGLILSEDVYALLDMPPFSRSAQDGYALCSKDRKDLCRGSSGCAGQTRRGSPDHDRGNGPGGRRLCPSSGRYR